MVHRLSLYLAEFSNIQQQCTCIQKLKLTCQLKSPRSNGQYMVFPVCGSPDAYTGCSIIPLVLQNYSVKSDFTQLNSYTNVIAEFCVIHGMTVTLLILLVTDSWHLPGHL